LRLEYGQTLDDIPEPLIKDCCQLVKANSIEGHKLAKTDVVYTMWNNLKKTGDMVTGQVGFHNEKAVRKVHVEKERDIINRLNKTKMHKENIDFQELRDKRDAKERQKQKEQQRSQRQREQDEQERREKEKELRSYDQIFTTTSENMKTNRDPGNDDDFM